jgi:hypothetical protein
MAVPDPTNGEDRVACGRTEPADSWTMGGGGLRRRAVVAEGSGGGRRWDLFE